MEELELPQKTIAYWRKDLVDEVSLIYPEGYTPEKLEMFTIVQFITNGYQTSKELNPYGYSTSVRLVEGSD